MNSSAEQKTPYPYTKKDADALKFAIRKADKDRKFDFIVNLLASEIKDLDEKVEAQGETVVNEYVRNLAKNYIAEKTDELEAKAKEKGCSVQEYLQSQECNSIEEYIVVEKVKSAYNNEYESEPEGEQNNKQYSATPKVSAMIVTCIDTITGNVSVYKLEGSNMLQAQELLRQATIDKDGFYSFGTDENKAKSFEAILNQSEKVFVENNVPSCKEFSKSLSEELKGNLTNLEDICKKAMEKHLELCKSNQESVPDNNPSALQSFMDGSEKDNSSRLTSNQPEKQEQKPHTQKLEQQKQQKQQQNGRGYK